MILLLLSISCSVAVSVLLKMARSRAIDVAQAIAVNYGVAIALCILLLRPDPMQLLTPATPWWVLVALGVLLPTVFIAMAAAVRHAGIVLSDAAQRLSLIIPLMAAFVVFGESLSPAKGSGIAVALLALGLLLVRTRDPATAQGLDDESAMPAPAAGRPRQAVFFLLCVWLGYGVIDILFKQMARSGAAFSGSLLAAFVLAGVVITGWLVARRTVWNRSSLWAGVLLGVLNFGNIYFYIRAHQHFPENPTLVFSAMNIGVISAGALVGAGVFRERLNRYNVTGVALALVAIILLVPR